MANKIDGVSLIDGTKLIPKSASLTNFIGKSASYKSNAQTYKIDSDGVSKAGTMVFSATGKIVAQAMYNGETYLGVKADWLSMWFKKEDLTIVDGGVIKALLSHLYQAFTALLKGGAVYA